MKVNEVKDDLSCYTLIVPFKSRYPRILHEQVWDRTEGTFKHQQGFNGKDIKVVLKDKFKITDGYLATVDYHY
jgi:hypothetical protein